MMTMVMTTVMTTVEMMMMIGMMMMMMIEMVMMMMMITIQVGKVSALAFLLNGSETELFLCEEGAVKITLARFFNHHDCNDKCHNDHPSL